MGRSLPWSPDPPLIRHFVFERGPVNSLIASEGMSMRVAITVMSNRVPDQRLKDCPIHIRKLFDVEAALSCRVSSEFRQEVFCLAVVQHAVQNRGGLTR